MKIYEVGPRDGLQGLSVVPTETKLELIDRLSETGLEYIEIGSFVGQKTIPQMADSGNVARRIKRHDGVTYSALVPNIKYYGDAREVDIPEIAVFLSANEEHNQANLGRDIATTKKKLREVIHAARDDGKTVRGYVSTVWGYRGHDTSMSNVTDISKWLIDEGVYQVSLGDTTGLATAGIVRDVLLAIRGEMPLDKFALHYHTKRADMREKIDAGYEMGIRVFDSSIGGLGGCPTDELLGNVDTEELNKTFRKRWNSNRR